MGVRGNPKHWAAIAIILVASCGVAATRHEQARDGVPYSVEIRGIDRSHALLRKPVEAASLCVSLRDEPPSNITQLKVRAGDDVKAMLNLLQARGYLGADVDVALDESTSPVTVRFHVSPGELYQLGDVTIEARRVDGETYRVTPPIGLQPGVPAAAATIRRGTDDALERLRERGHPFPKLVTRSLDTNHQRHRVNLRLLLDAGPKATFGGLRVVGLNGVEESYVQRLAPWARGDEYKQSDVDELERRLLASGLFATARVESDGGVDATGTVPLRVVVAERKPRAVRLTVRYDTDVGAGGSASWEHRNLFGGGESLKVESRYSRELYGVDAVYRQPSILFPSVSLASLASWKRENTDAYDSDSTEAELFLDREVLRKLRVGAGLGYLYSIVTQLDETDRYGFLYAPLRANWDHTDDLLDPMRGWRVKVDCAPYIDTLGSDLQFWRNTVEGSYYVRLLKSPRLVFAHRMRGGWAVGASRDDLPADLRFYAGGGGSVRGYEYQSIGDQQDGTPLGGSSLLETSVEFRLRVSEKLGLVVFSDGGTAYEEALPGSDQTIRWSAGAGIRYYSDIGPFRVDVAAPMNKREQDESYAVYVSLGQAF